MGNDEEQWRVVEGTKQRAMLQCAKKACTGMCPRSRAKEGWDSSSSKPLAICKECDNPFRKHQGKLVWVEVKTNRSRGKAGKPNPKQDTKSKQDARGSGELAKLKNQLASQQAEIAALKKSKAGTSMEVDEEIINVEADDELNQRISNLQKKLRALRECDPIIREAMQGGHEEQLANTDKELKEAQAQRRGNKPFANQKKETEQYLQRMLSTQQGTKSKLDAALEQQAAANAHVVEMQAADTSALAAVEKAKADLAAITQQMADELKEGGVEPTAQPGSRELTASTIGLYFNALDPKVVGERQGAIQQVMQLLHSIDSQDIQVKAAHAAGTPIPQQAEEVEFNDANLRQCAELAFDPLEEDAPETTKSKRRAEVDDMEKKLINLKGKKLSLKTTRKTITK